jgi:hypothetical protein
MGLNFSKSGQGVRWAISSDWLDSFYTFFEFPNILLNWIADMADKND